MIENVHKQIEDWHATHPDREPTRAKHWSLIADASVQVGPASFFSLLMASAAGLAVTLVPVLMGYFIRGKIPAEDRNPLNRWLLRGYRPLLEPVLATNRKYCGQTGWPTSKSEEVTISEPGGCRVPLCVFALASATLTVA
jgi:Cu(I)/Ag(I) efflux system membrane protein CusA/SilA